MAIKHIFTSPKADGGDATLIRPSNWNDDHVIDATGIVIGGDTNLYRNAANVLKTDDDLIIGAGSVYLGSGTQRLVPSNTTANTIAVQDAGAAMALKARGILLSDSYSHPDPPLKGIQFGLDVNLYWSASHILKTDDAFIAAGKITALNEGFEATGAVNSGIKGTALALSADVLLSQTSGFGDTFPRFRIVADGDLYWGPGTATYDSRLVRSTTAGRMILDSNSAAAATELGIVSTSGQRAKLDARVAGDTFARAELWGDATMQGLSFGTGAAGVDTNLYRNGANALRTDDDFSARTFGVVAGAGKFMQFGTAASGSITIAMGGGAFATGTITFNTTFDNVPVVMLTRRTSASGAPKIHVMINGTVTTSSCPVLAGTGDGSTSGASAVIDWLAIDVGKVL